jgi:serine/threonine protein phosphatase PrpC
MIFTSYTDKGSRSSNQDAFFESEKLFIVCDGVGGLSYGDVASKLACSSFTEYFTANPAESYDCEYVNKALQYTIEKFKETVSKYSETKDMCTTVVLMAFDADGAIVGWMGDSRLYHVRPDTSGGEILFVTEDDSLINQLKKKGEDVSQVSRNIITKCLSLNRNDTLNFQGIAKNDIKSGDYFFLCTDGVLENVTDDILSDVLSSQITTEEKAGKIRELCEGKTKDNFTFILIEI